MSRASCPRSPDDLRALGRRRVAPSVRVALALVAVLSLALAAPGASAQPVSAEDRAAARAIGKDGIELYEQGKYREALDRLSRAHAIVRLTTTGLWRARCLAKLGRLVESSEQYLEVTRIKPAADALAVHRKAVDEARQERQELLPRIPRVRVTSEREVPADLAITIDGKPVSHALIGVERPIDPGPHELLLSRGSWRKAQAFETTEGVPFELQLEIPAEVLASAEPAARVPPPGAAPPAAVDKAPDEPAVAPGGGPGAQEAVGWLALGLGGAGLIAGALTGALALDAQGTLDEGCTAGNCPPELHGEVDSFYGLRTASTIALIAGGTLLTGGVLLVLTAPADEPAGSAATGVSLRAGPQGAALRVRF